MKSQELTLIEQPIPDIESHTWFADFKEENDKENEKRTPQPLPLKLTHLNQLQEAIFRHFIQHDHRREELRNSFPEHLAVSQYIQKLESLKDKIISQ